MFPVRYELNFYILFRINSVFITRLDSHSDGYEGYWLSERNAMSFVRNSPTFR
jgi:hypothetical protein